nr:MAG TPA: hypothetical protein [Caudoviricetes sp.]
MKLDGSFLKRHFQFYLTYLLTRRGPLEKAVLYFYF